MERTVPSERQAPSARLDIVEDLEPLETRGPLPKENCVRGHLETKDRLDHPELRECLDCLEETV